MKNSNWVVKGKVLMEYQIIRNQIMQIPNDIAPKDDPAINKIKLLNYMDKLIKNLGGK